MSLRVSEPSGKAGEITSAFLLGGTCGFGQRQFFCLVRCLWPACFPAQTGVVDFISESLFNARETRNGIRGGGDGNERTFRWPPVLFGANHSPFCSPLVRLSFVQADTGRGGKR